MTKLFVLLSTTAILTTCGCKKSNAEPANRADEPGTTVPAELSGNWMYGNFSLTEYWSQDPDSYLGNALQFAFAFTFNSDGTYVQYFTSSSVTSGVVTYQQSVTKGTVTINTNEKTIKTHPLSSHYRRTSNGAVVEERDLRKEELSSATTYNFTTGTETSGSKALYLTLEGTQQPMTFLKK